MADKPTYEELDSIVKHLTAELDKDKQEKKVLLESEQRYLKIFKYAVDSIFIIDPSTGSFIDCNEKAAQRLGYTKEELLKLKVFDINIAEQRPEIHERFKKQVDGESILFETTHLRDNQYSFRFKGSENIVVICSLHHRKKKAGARIEKTSRQP